MDNITRLQYLEAMGVDVWVSREKETSKEHEAFGEEKVTVEAKLYDHPNGLMDDAWHILQNQVTECQKCSLSEKRTQTVFGTGNKHADWMIIGEAPGHNEDLEGEPFLGKPGDLLSEMLRAIGLARDSVYIANILKCKTSNNRDPKVEEIKSCRDYLQQQIRLVKPSIIVAVGRVAAQTLLDTNKPLTKLRGIPHQIEGIPLIAVYHPAFLLRSLLEKRKAWEDLQLAMKHVKNI